MAEGDPLLAAGWIGGFALVDFGRAMHRSQMSPEERSSIHYRNVPGARWYHQKLEDLADSLYDRLDHPRKE